LRATGIAGTPRGYIREDFEGDFAAYIPSVAAKTPSVSATPQQMNIFNDLEAENIRNTRADVADKTPPNQLETNICCGVADENPGFAATEGIGLVDGEADHFAAPSEPCADRSPGCRFS